MNKKITILVCDHLSIYLILPSTKLATNPFLQLAIVDTIARYR